MITLYPHQREVIDRLRASLARHGSVILCANPGFGKTRCAKWIAAESVQRVPKGHQTGNILFAVHRRGLVDNASQSFAEEPLLPHGVVMSDRNTAWRHRVQVASIDTLLSWHIESGKYTAQKTYDLIIFDECHSHFQKLFTYKKAHDKKRKELGKRVSLGIGLSATPEAKGLADGYRDIVQGPSTEWLIGNGFLSPFRYCSGAKTTDGRLNGKSVVSEWSKHAKDRATVGFFSKLDYAKEAQNELIKAGIRAQYVDAKTKDETRRQIFRDLGKGHIDYLCNVGIVERGTNIPEISCVQLCLEIGSVVRYRQMVGRGSRNPHGKNDCLVLDHGSNIKKHGFFEDDPPWTLDRSRSVESEHTPRPIIECPSCGNSYRGGRCRSCGYEPSRSERRAQGLDFNGSELVEIVRKPKQNTAQKTSEQIMVSSLYAAARSGRTFSQAIAIAYGKAAKCGTKFKVPRRVTVGGCTVTMLQKNDPARHRKVKDLFSNFN